MSQLHKELDVAGRKLRTARQRVETVMGEAEGVARAAYNYGIPETTIAALLGVNRMTVRKWLGKR